MQEIFKQKDINSIPLRLSDFSFCPTLLDAAAAFYILLSPYNQRFTYENLLNNLLLLSTTTSKHDANVNVWKNCDSKTD